MNLFKDVSKGWFHIVQCQTVLLLLQSASYLLCHDRVFFGKFAMRACCYVTTTCELVLHRPISLSLHQQSCDSLYCHHLLISESFSVLKYQKKSEKCSSQFPRSQSQIASFVQKESKNPKNSLFSDIKDKENRLIFTFNQQMFLNCCLKNYFKETFVLIYSRSCRWKVRSSF